ncbi:MAG: YmdB family metallophosphoesterase [Coprobacillus sp.]|nr:YmdB family metallophosphoesterase [Coprobacillus sp.]
MKILFIGDIVGKIGRRIVKEKVPYYVEKYGINFVIANGENATHGKGLNYNHYVELINDGIDVITLGNHYKSKKEIYNYIDGADHLIRPYNVIDSNLGGMGSEVYNVDGINVRVTEIVGSAFINDVTVNSPYLSLMEVLENEGEDKSDIHIVDFHGEATGEKIGFAYAFDGKVSAVLGTHTHVQTRDARILPEGTGFMCDVGMCGYADGILGCETSSVNLKTLYGQNTHFVYPDEGRAMFSAVVLDIEDKTGKCTDIFPILFEE